MQQIAAEPTNNKTEGAWNGVERRRVERFVETLARLGGQGENLAAVAHDARNMVTALGLYCDLLEEPGVLASNFIHYAEELRLVAAASRRLVEKLVALDAAASRTQGASAGLDGALRSAGAADLDSAGPQSCRAEGHVGPGAESGLRSLAADYRQHGQSWEFAPALPIANLAAELMANRNLLAALAGPQIALTVEAHGGAQPVRLTGEDLTRLLVNLVKNASEAMPAGGRIHIGLGEGETLQGVAPCLELTVEDNGPGIADETCEKIFASGYTTRTQARNPQPNHALAQARTADAWPQSHRGLGLTIARALVEGAGGRITAAGRAQGGACFTIELPVHRARIRERGIVSRK